MMNKNVESMSTDCPKVGIILLSYNGEIFLPKALESLLEIQYPRRRLFFIFIDNASSDQSFSLLSDFVHSHSEFHTFLIKNKKNFGFAKGNNIGFEFAILKELDYIITLNQDILEMDPMWVQYLVETLESNPTFAIAQARIMRFPQKHLVNTVGNRYHYLGFGYSEGNGMPYDKIKNSAIQTIMYSSGGALCTRVSLLSKYGGFDEETFMYHEDVELSLRFRLLGYKIVCNHNAIVYHQYEFNRSIKKYYWMERNRLWVLFTYYKPKTLALIFPIFILMEIALLFFALRSGFFGEKIKSYGYFLNLPHLKRLFKRRKYIQSIRVLSDKELLNFTETEIRDQEVKNVFLNRFGNPVMKKYFLLIKKFL